MHTDRTPTRPRLAIGVLTLAATLTPVVLGQLTIDWSTIDCCGGTISGGSLEITATIGQFDASESLFSEFLSGGTLSIAGGLCANTLPVPVVRDAVDFNNNGVFPEDQDVVDFFKVLVGGNCPWSCRQATSASSTKIETLLEAAPHAYHARGGFRNYMWAICVLCALACRLNSRCATSS